MKQITKQHFPNQRQTHTSNQLLIKKLSQILTSNQLFRINKLSRTHTSNQLLINKLSQTHT